MLQHERGHLSAPVPPAQGCSTQPQEPPAQDKCHPQAEPPGRVSAVGENMTRWHLTSNSAECKHTVATGLQLHSRLKEMPAVSLTERCKAAGFKPRTAPLQPTGHRSFTPALTAAARWTSRSRQLLDSNATEKNPACGRVPQAVPGGTAARVARARDAPTRRARTQRSRSAAPVPRAEGFSWQKQEGEKALPRTASVSPQLLLPAAICPHTVSGPQPVAPHAREHFSANASISSRPPAAPQLPPHVTRRALPFSLLQAQLPLGLASRFRITATSPGLLKMYLQAAAVKFFV